MREIKFRLRDRLHKIVGYEKWYVGHWDPDNPDEGFSLDSGYWEASPCWLYSTDGERWTPTFLPHRYKSQYTGLKDKNGKEIYEGDILTHHDSLYTKLKTWKVIYKDASFALKHIHEFAHTSLNAVPYYGEVIGNIYENPELLEAKDANSDS